MTEELIILETAKLAKEKGFTWFHALLPSLIFEDKYRTTQSLLQKWLREKHDIEIYVRSSVDLYNKKYWTTFLPNGCLENKNNTYEEALEFGLQKGLKLIQQ
jgi:hypothetical protein